MHKTISPKLFCWVHAFKNSFKNIPRKKKLKKFSYEKINFTLDGFATKTIIRQYCSTTLEFRY